MFWSFILDFIRLLFSKPSNDLRQVLQCFLFPVTFSYVDKMNQIRRKKKDIFLSNCSCSFLVFLSFSSPCFFLVLIQRKQIRLFSLLKSFCSFLFLEISLSVSLSFYDTSRSICFLHLKDFELCVSFSFSFFFLI